MEQTGFRAFTRDAALWVDVHSDLEYIHESLLTWNRFGERVVEVELPVKAERATAPYTSFITVSVGGVLLGVLLGAVAMLADLIARLKFQVEEVLHDSRRMRGRS